MTLRSWRRRMFAWGTVLLVAGMALMMGGGLYAGMQQDDTALRGIWIGSAGAVAIVVGGVFLKGALFGPVPAAYASDLVHAEDEP